MVLPTKNKNTHSDSCPQKPPSTLQRPKNLMRLELSDDETETTPNNQDNDLNANHRGQDDDDSQTLQNPKFSTKTNSADKQQM